MSPLRTSCFTLILASLGSAQYNKTTIQNMYSATFAALHDAKTKEDITQMVDAFDAPDWVSNQPNGQTLTRPEAVRLLESLLATPPEQRPSPKMDIIFMNETQWSVTVLYWVYTAADEKLVGSIARDTFVRTARGWRRTRHEKYFPDRPLVVNGKAVIAPGTEPR
jgi:hypothetical protein